MLWVKGREIGAAKMVCRQNKCRHLSGLFAIGKSANLHTTLLCISFSTLETRLALLLYFSQLSSESVQSIDASNQQNMPVHDNFQVPSSAQALPLPDTANASFFVLFLSSTEQETKQPWCSDVRAALPLLNRIFSAETSPDVHYVYVGQKAE
jgi:hypothetical protein